MTVRRGLLGLALLCALARTADARIGYGVIGVRDASTLWRGVWAFDAELDAGAGYKINGEKITTLLKVPGTLRYGWRERTELGLTVPFAYQKSLSSIYDGSGISDASMFLKYQMSADEGGTPASATELRIGVGPNNPVSSDAVTCGVFYSVSKTFAKGESFGHMNLGYTFYSNGNSDVFSYAFAYDRRLTPSLRGSVALTSGNLLVPRLKKDMVVELGLTKEVSPTLEFGIAGGAGVSSAGPSWQMRLAMKKEMFGAAGEATPYTRAEFAPPPPPTAVAVLQTAENAAHIGDYEGAVARYREALDKDSGIPSAWNNLGIALYRLGRTQEALQAYEKASSLDPNNADIYFNEGLAYYKLGDLLAARRAFARAVELNPDHSLAKTNLRALSGPNDAP